MPCGTPNTVTTLPTSTPPGDAGHGLNHAMAPLAIAAGLVCAASLSARIGGVLVVVLVTLTVLAIVMWLSAPGGPPQSRGRRDRNTRCRQAILLAIPAALAGAVSAPLPAPHPGAQLDSWTEMTPGLSDADRRSAIPNRGPTRFDGIVRDRVQRRPGPGGQELLFVVSRGATKILCIAPASRIGTRPMPGDRVRGIGRHTGHRSLRPGAPLLPAVRATSFQCTPRDAALPSLNRLAALAQHGLEAGLREHMPPRVLGLISSLVLGAGPAMPNPLIRAHRATGLTHLLAVSGAHAAMLAWLLAVPFAGMGSARQRPGYRVVCASILLIYGAITGLEAPMFRAVAAYLLALSAGRSGRRVSTSAALLAPALLTAIATPHMLFTASFCLSYAAVLGLALSGAFGNAGHDMPHGGWFRTWIGAPMRASLWATAFTAPCTLFLFGQIAPCTVVATPFLAPLVAMILAVGLLVGCLSWICPPLAALCSWPAAIAADWYSNVVIALDYLPGTPVLATAAPSGWTLGAFVAFGAMTCGAVRLSKRRWRTGLFAASLTVCAAWFVTPPSLSCADPDVTVLAVGHGAAVLSRIERPEKSPLLVAVDCGSIGRPARAARAMTRALLARGTRQLDWLVLTHSDSDHVGGVPDLVERVHVQHAVMPEHLRGSRAARTLAAHGTHCRFLLPGTEFAPCPSVRIKAPDLPATASSNERSLWVWLQPRPTPQDHRAGADTVLITGDAGEAAVETMVAMDRADPADVLVLPHHGRVHHRIEMLLTASLARAAIASTGDRSPTAQTTIARAAGVRVWQTGAVGNIRVAATPSGLLLEPQRAVPLHE